MHRVDPEMHYSVCVHVSVAVGRDGKILKGAEPDSAMSASISREF